jgi:LuxR family maltose regulon positive regulatory protein
VDEQFLLARSQTALGDADQAIPLLTWMAAEAERDGRGYDLVQIEVLRSLAYLEQVQLDSAVSALRHALHLAEPEGYVRVFLDEGVSMFRLLEIAQGREVEVDAIGDLLAVRPLVAGDNDRGRRLRLGRSLTSRERSVLRLLAVGLTIAEMSDVLSISVDTVKLDLFRVYLKLGVASRTAAVHRARELGLFTTTAQERPDTSDEAAI